MYVDQSDFGPQLAARLAEIEIEYSEVSAELPRAETALAVAKEVSFRARARHNHFCLRINRASHRGDLFGVLSAALADEELAERKLRDAADAKLTRAEKGLANLQWRHQSLAADVQQLRKALGPLPMEAPPLEVVRRPARQEVDADDIVLPAPRSAA